MRLVTWNEKNEPDLPPWQVRSDCQSMARLVGRGATIIAGQEFEDRSDRAALEEAFPGWLVEGAYPVPLLANPRYFEVLASGYELAHGGRAGISPHRGFSWMLTRRRFRPRVRPFVTVGTHMVSGAWTDGHEAQAWRRDRWREHHAKLAAFVAQQNTKGRDVFVLGDMNRTAYDPKTITAQARTLAHHGLDHIVYAPADGLRIRNASGRTIRERLYTDHLPVVAEVALTA